MFCTFQGAVACTTLATVAFADATLDDVKSFTIPSFDYYSLQSDGTPHRMLEALERGGIIALKNVPNYAKTRERYLASAVQCAVASEHRDDATRYLSTKEFHDGTRRLTLRAAAGRNLMTTDVESLDAMATTCPGHRQLHEEFSTTLELAVDTFALALDQTPLTLGDGERVISARKLIGDATRLDHFHAYEATNVPPRATRRTLSVANMHQDLSLAMHEDHGLFIAMAAPKFYTVDATDGTIQERRLASDASGLVIGATELDEIVRPDLKEDEVVLMMGTGASRWLQTSHHFPAVTHGMQMPQELRDVSKSGQRHLRAWFGKMTLLPTYQRMLQSNLDFGEFVNRTTRHLLANGDATSDVKAIGCAGGRHLLASDESCTFAKCTLRPGTEKPPTVGCHQACNFHTEFYDKKCANKCDCNGTTTDANVCWMLCVAHLPLEQCPLKDQHCLGLTITCNATGIDTPPPTHGNEPSTTLPPSMTPPATEVPSNPEIPTDTKAPTPEPHPTNPPIASVPPTITPLSTNTTSLPTGIPPQSPPLASLPPRDPPVPQKPVSPGPHCS